MAGLKVYIKNALEIIVIEEAKVQATQIDRSIREEVDLSEVIAFALNRLPALYASSDRGWLQQRKRANTEYRKSITNQLHQAFLRVGNNPLVRVSPLPLYELERPDYCLLRLREILRRPDLTWKEVPSLVQESLGAKSGANMEHLSSYDRRRILETKNFLRKSRAHQAKSQQEKPMDPIEVQEFESYMIGAEYHFVNVLERPVVQIVERQMQQMQQGTARNLELGDVVVYVLNRFPPLYATNAKGFQQQRDRVRNELLSDIQAKTIQAILELGKTPRRLVGPLPFIKFEREHEQAIENLKDIFQAEDLTCGKAVEMVEKAVVGTSLSSRLKSLRSTLIQELVNRLGLNPQRHDLHLEQIDNHLVFSTGYQDTFWAIVDNPDVIARAVLTLFPETGSMELQYQRLPFPLILTKHEMEEEALQGDEDLSEITQVLS